MNKVNAQGKSKYPIRLVLNGQASKELEWHCKHYTGRKLMKKIEGGKALAEEFGVGEEVLKKTCTVLPHVSRSSSFSSSLDQYRG
jgi:hypothetical protein